MHLILKYVIISHVVNTRKKKELKIMVTKQEILNNNPRLAETDKKNNEF